MSRVCRAAFYSCTVSPCVAFRLLVVFVAPLQVYRHFSVGCILVSVLTHLLPLPAPPAPVEHDVF